MNREERRKAAAIEARATRTRSIVADVKIVGYIELNTESVEIDFNRTYTFEVEDNGRLYRWTGARAERRGDLAVFDYQDGKNGRMVEMSPEMAKLFEKP
ncbi:hypothetical protein ACIPUD_10535 [Bradyrhizobium sp. CAR08]